MKKKWDNTERSIIKLSIGSWENINLKARSWMDHVNYSDGWAFQHSYCVFCKYYRDMQDFDKRCKQCPVKIALLSRWKYKKSKHDLPCEIILDKQFGKDIRFGTDFVVLTLEQYTRKQAEEKILDIKQWVLDKLNEILNKGM